MEDAPTVAAPQAQQQKKKKSRGNRRKRGDTTTEEQLEEFLFGKTLKRKQKAADSEHAGKSGKKRKNAGEGGDMLFLDRAPARIAFSDSDEEDDAQREEAQEAHAGTVGGSSDEEDVGGAQSDDNENDSDVENGDEKRGTLGQEEDDDDEGDEDTVVREGSRGKHVGGAGVEQHVDEVTEDEDGDSDDDAESAEAGEEEEDARARTHVKASTTGRGAVWQDSDDDEVEVQVAEAPRLRKLRKEEGQQKLAGPEYVSALRKQYQAIHGPASWAKLPDRDAVESGDQLLRSAAALVGPSSAGALLPPGDLEVSRVKDANAADPNAAVVQSVDWHPNAQLLLTAGLDKRLRLFQVDGVKNDRVQSIFLEDMPIRNASFVAGGSMILASGRRSFAYLVDVEAGGIHRLAVPPSMKQASLETFVACRPALTADASMAAFLGDAGHVQLFSLKTRTWVTGLKMNGTARATTFSPDGRELLTEGSDGLIYTWDLRMKRCVSTLADEGNFNPASLALSPSMKYLATGSGSGIVNVYDVERVRGGAGVNRTSPLKALTNLTTTIDTLAFSSDSQLLVMASRMKRESLRLVHLPSLTVIPNWPTSSTPLHYVHCVAFSPNCGFLAIGNAKGRVLLYRLHHYVQA